MISTLRLHRFRCYDSLNWEIPSEGAMLVGDNAQGKTGLLEAVCFALTLHSPRTGRMEHLAKHGGQSFAISLQTDSSTQRLQWQNRHLSLSRDGFPVKDYSAFLDGAPPVAWLDNGDMALVTGSGETRRRYLDFLGAQWHPVYRAALRDYRKALKLRNLLLHNPRCDNAALRSYAEVMARSGDVLVALRTQLVELLRPHFTRYHADICGRGEQADIIYSPDSSLPLLQALEHSLADDKRAGFTTVGPHRDDFRLLLAGMSAADFASEGQQRTLAIALVLAQAGLLQVETGRPPILLIDDIFGELDPSRRKALLSTLPAESQVFITTTHLTWLGDAPSPLPLLRINSGHIE